MGAGTEAGGVMVVSSGVEAIGRSESDFAAAVGASSGASFEDGWVACGRSLSSSDKRAWCCSRSLRVRRAW